MAAEYSRELGVKSRAGQEQALALGFEMGPMPCLGLRRIAVRRDGSARELQGAGPRIPQLERIRWVPGPPEQVALVRHLFATYARTPATIERLVSDLATSGQRAHQVGRAITPEMVKTILRSEAYIGNFVWGRSLRAAGVRRRPPPERVTRIENTIEPIVERHVWDQVQARLDRRKPMRFTAEEALAALQRAIALNPALIALDLTSYGCPTRRIYEQYLGTLTRAMRLAGRKDSDAAASDHARSQRSRLLAYAMIGDIRNAMRQAGFQCVKLHQSQKLRVNGADVQLQLLWPRRHRDGTFWYVHKVSALKCDLVLMPRMQEDNRAHSFVLVPLAEYRTITPWLSAHECSSAIPAIYSCEELVRRLARATAGCARPSQSDG